MRRFVVFILALFAVAARAQEQYSYDTADPPWSRADIEEFVADAAVDDGSAAFIRSLHTDLGHALQHGYEGYLAAVRRAGEAQSRFRKDHPEIRDPQSEVGEDFGRAAAFYSWQRERDRLETQFLDDVEEFLDGPARELWVQRRIDLHRRNLFRDLRTGWAYISGGRSTMDLVAVIGDLHIEPESTDALSELIRAYRIEMHDVIDDWRQRLIDFSEELQAAYVSDNLRGTPEGDARAARWNELWPRYFTFGREITDLNNEFIQRIKGAVSESDLVRFDDAINRLRFPLVFVPCPVEAATNRLRDEPALNDEARGELEVIWEEYRARRDALRLRIVGISDQFETPQRMLEMEMRVREAQERFTEEGEDFDWREYYLTDHPAEPLYIQSRDLAESASRELRALFTDAEFEELPLSIQLTLEWWKE